MLLDLLGGREDGLDLGLERWPVELLLGRYGARATVPIGPLGPDRPAILRLNRDDGAEPWFVSPGPNSAGELADLVICGYEPARSAPVSSLAPDPRPPNGNEEQSRGERKPAT